MAVICGYVEQVTREHVRGWAYDAADFNRPLLIEIVLDGQTVAIGPTDQPRGDLAQPGLDRDTFGFTITLPEGLRIELPRLVVRVAGSGEPIPMSDRSAMYEGFVDAHERDAIRGWGWRCGFPEERVQIVVRHKGEVVGSGIADGLRPDLVGAGVGDGRHAFLIALPIAEQGLDPAQLYVEFGATGAQLTDRRYPDRAPPPLPIGAAPPAPPPPEPAEPEVAPPSEPPVAARPAVARNPVRPARATVVAARPVPRQPTPPPTMLQTPVAALPQPAAPAPVPPAPAAPPPPAPPLPTISKELYEALRGSLNFGDEGGLF